MFDLTSVTTIEGEQLSINIDNGAVYIEDSKIIFADRLARNGVVHIIYPDLVLDSSD